MLYNVNSKMQGMRKELTSTSKVQFCGCPNQMRVVDDTVGAVDLDQVVLVNEKNIKYNGILSERTKKHQRNDANARSAASHLRNAE